MAIKLNLFFLLTPLFLLYGMVGKADDETIDFTEQKYTNGQEVTETKGKLICFTFSKGTSDKAPKYSSKYISISGGVVLP